MRLQASWFSVLAETCFAWFSKITVVFTICKAEPFFFFFCYDFRKHFFIFFEGCLKCLAYMISYNAYLCHHFQCCLGFIFIISRIVLALLYNFQNYTNFLIIANFQSCQCFFCFVLFFCRNFRSWVSIWSFSKLLEFPFQNFQSYLSFFNNFQHC